MELWGQDDPYAVLGVAPDAASGAIRHAYRARARRLHPDLNDGAADDFKRLVGAYEILGDAGRRRMYDRVHGLASGAPESAGHPIEAMRHREPDEWQILTWLGRWVAAVVVLSILLIAGVAFAVGGGDGSGSVPGPELRTMCQTPDGWVDCRALDPSPP